MEDKYYTPNIEEFFVGFEFEFFVDPNKTAFKHLLDKPGWTKDVFDWAWSDIIFDDYKHSPEEIKDLYRVKYLDQSDIESLGGNVGRFPIPIKGPFSLHMKGVHTLRHYSIGIWSKISRIEIMEGENYKFSGEIKNKSEFKKLLAQLDLL